MSILNFVNEVSRTVQFNIDQHRSDWAKLIVQGKKLSKIEMNDRHTFIDTLENALELINTISQAPQYQDKPVTPVAPQAANDPNDGHGDVVASEVKAA